MATNATQYVVPAGYNLVSNIMGGDIGNGYRNAGQSVFDTGNGDPMQTFRDAWNANRLGYGTVAAPDVLNAAAQESQNRYLGDPNNGGAGGWNARWNQWNGTDVTGPDGKVLFSPVHQTGLNVSAGYGGRGPDGNPIGPINSQANQGFTYMQNLLASNPDLNTGNIMSGYNQQMQNSPFAAPNQAAYMQAIQAANGVGAMQGIGSSGLQQAGYLNQLPGSNFDKFGNQLVSGVQGLNQGTNFDQYGQRGIDQTNALDTAGLQKLTRNIDTSAQQSLANQLQSTQQSMEAMGLGRSGAGQMAMLQNQAQILAQANRDKQSVLADYTNKNADRGAAAINLATQQGYGGQGQQFGAMNNALQQQAQLGYGGMGQKFGAVQNAATLGTQLAGQAQNQWSALQGQAGMQGLSDLARYNLQGQQGASNLYGQTMANASTRYGQDTNNYLNSLQGSQALQNQQLQLEAQGQHMALGDWLGLQQNRDQSQQNSMNQALQTADMQRQIQQDRLNQQLQASYMPFSSQMQIATGTTPMSAPQGRPSFWQAAAPQFANGVGQAAPAFAENLWNGK